LKKVTLVVGKRGASSTNRDQRDGLTARTRVLA